MDVEDLFFDDKTYVQKVKDNEALYKKMIFDIVDWVEYHRTHDDFDYQKEFHKLYQKLVSTYKIYCKKNVLIFTYRKLLAQKVLENDPLMWSLLQKRPARNLSGVTIITVLTSPYPNGQEFSCKHNCYYCPNEPDQPRSYLKKEPAVARANRNNFDAILQMEDRIHSLLVNGHEIDKLEIIIEGGTYTEYPPEYLEKFHRDLIYSANTYFDSEKRQPYTIYEEIKINATARVRIIGICIETRPDTLIDEHGTTWLTRFRDWGVTRVQLGVQHTDNTILKRVNRGHTIEDAEKAIQYLKDNCFKVDIHLMPDLPFSSPELDKQMVDYVFKTTNLQPDQIKIYPCEVTPWTVIKDWHDQGTWTPYAQTNERALLDVVKYAMESCPPWIRLPRVIRDIPLSYIEGGNMYPNLRQMLTDELAKEGSYSNDIRARECGRNTKYKVEKATYICRNFDTFGGKEYFISLESEDRRAIFGFTRLRILYKNPVYQKQEFNELKNKGLIRELHVYGNVVPVGHTKKNDSQHKGIGKKLIQLAENIAKKNGCNGTAVISGIGVTKYYEKLGYNEEGSFMIKHFTDIYAVIRIILLCGILFLGIVILFHGGIIYTMK